MEPVILWVADCLAVHYRGIGVGIFSVVEKKRATEGLWSG